MHGGRISRRERLAKYKHDLIVRNHFYGGEIMPKKIRKKSKEDTDEEE